MQEQHNIAERGLATSLYLVRKLRPLLGAPDYEPVTRDMQVALPNIDYFLRVHTLASLEELAVRLADLNQGLNGGSLARHSI